MEIIGVSIDDMETHKAFANYCKITYNLISDKGGYLRRRYGVPDASAFAIWPGRVTYLINSKGIVDKVINSPLRMEIEGRSFSLISEIAGSFTLRKKADSFFGLGEEFEKSHPLFKAILNADIEKINQLVNKGNLDIWIGKKESQTTSPLHKAVRADLLEACRLFIEKGMDPDIQDLKQNRETPLYVAASEGKFQIMKLLLEHKANPNFKNENGLTPMFASASEGSVACLELLIQYGGDVNTKDSYDETPLVNAVRENRSEAAKLLLLEGANPNVFEYKNKISVLHHALHNDQVDLAESLIVNGAELDQDLNKSYETPIRVAINKKFFRLIENPRIQELLALKYETVKWKIRISLFFYLTILAVWTFLTTAQYTDVNFSFFLCLFKRQFIFIDFFGKNFKLCPSSNLYISSCLPWSYI